MYRNFAPTANRVTTIKFVTTKTYCRVKRCYLRGVDESTVIFFFEGLYSTIKVRIFCTCAVVFHIFSFPCWRENQILRLCLLLWKHLQILKFFQKPHQNFYTESGLCHWLFFSSVHLSMDAWKISLNKQAMDGLRNKFEYHWSQPGSGASFKGTVTRDVWLLVFFMNQFLPSPRVSL